MKKISSFSVMYMLIVFSALAQVKNGSRNLPLPRIATAADATLATNGVSSYTGFLLADMMMRDKNPQSFDESAFIKKYGLIAKGGVLYANSFIKCANGFEASGLKGFGVLPGSNYGKIATGLIPIEQITQVARAAGVAFVAIGQPLTLFLDSARNVTNVTKVHQGQPPLTMPYKGDGVVVGMIDIGFDFNHPTFYDSTGVNNYRIKKAWMQRSASGTPPPPYTYGTELATQAALLAAKTDDTTENHGTHTSGIAAGSGGFINSSYVGIAPHADIVMVGGDINSDVKIADAIAYIQNYAASVGKPSVINMSFGTNKGPHDGTSMFDQYADAAIAPGKLLVSAAGNDGEANNFIGHSFTGTDTTLSTFFIFNTSTSHILNGSGFVDIWGVPNQNFTVVVSLYNFATGLYEDQSHFQIPANINAVFLDTLYGTNSLPVPLKFTTGIHPNVNTKPEVLMELDNSAQPDTTGTWALVVTVKGQNTAIQMWGNEQIGRFDNIGMPLPFVSGTSDHTVSDGGGCGNSTISVGAFTTKNSWKSIVFGQINSNDTISAIASFSAHGPTADGRTKPDITSPGQYVVSSFNSHFTGPYTSDYFASIVDTIVSGGVAYPLAVDAGTSMAAPVVTGILALWLQKNPSLTMAQALTIMKATAMQDGFTGAIPASGSNTWGWGKINAFAGLTTLDVAGIEPSDMMKAYPNPATNELNISLNKASSATDVWLFDMTGKVVFQQHLSNTSAGYVYTVNTNVLAVGSYVLKVNSDKVSASFKITKR